MVLISSPGTRAMLEGIALSSHDGLASNTLRALSEVVCTDPCCLLWVQKEIEHVCFLSLCWC